MPELALQKQNSGFLSVQREVTDDAEFADLWVWDTMQEHVPTDDNK
jgi:hypothetical protein